MQLPTVGRTVHYVSHGTPVMADGSQAFESCCRAAIITEVDQDQVGLCVLNPTGIFLTRGVSHAEDKTDVPGMYDLYWPAGTWHWPEWVED